MKNLHREFLDNFLFEERFLYRGGPSRAPEAKGAAPKSTEIKEPTVDDVKDRIKHIRDNLAKIKNPQNKKKLEEHLKKIEKTVDDLKDSKAFQKKRSKIFTKTLMMH